MRWLFLWAACNSAPLARPELPDLAAQPDLAKQDLSVPPDLTVDPGHRCEVVDFQSLNAGGKDGNQWIPSPLTLGDVTFIGNGDNGQPGSVSINGNGYGGNPFSTDYLDFWLPGSAKFAAPTTRVAFDYGAENNTGGGFVVTSGGVMLASGVTSSYSAHHLDLQLAAPIDELDFAGMQENGSDPATGFALTNFTLFGDACEAGTSCVNGACL